MDRSEFLKPRVKQPAGAVLNFPMEIDRELVAEKLDALTARIEVDLKEQMAAILEAVKRVEDAVASMPKWEKQEPITIPPVDLSPILNELKRPRTRTITGTRNEHGLINLNSVKVIEE